MSVAKLDRDLFHRILWSRSNRLGKVTFRTAELAEELQLSQFTISRVMQEFIDNGRVKKLKAPRRAGCTYKVVDPDEWSEP